MAAKPLNQYALKSQAFMPTSSKLVTQYLVVDHLNNHYKKLNSAKPRIDDSHPKSWHASQKVRNQTHREAQSAMSKHGNMSTRKSLDSNWNTTKDSNYEYSRSVSSPDFRHDRSQSSEYYRQNSDYGGMGTQDPDYYATGHQQQHDSWPLSQGNSNDEYYESGQHATQKKPAQPKSGDVLDKFGHHFTSGGEFQPRILQRKSSSKLSSTKFYNPPKSSANDKNKNRDDAEATQRQESTMGENTMLLNETLMSRDARENRAPKDVPGLNITTDEDNLRWLQQKQNQKHQQHKSSAAIKTTGGNNRRPSKMESIIETTPREPDTAVNMNTYSQSPPRAAIRKPIKFSDESKEEEIYMKFMVDVTSDILDHGIATDTVLKRVFSRHLDRVRDKVSNEARLYDILNDICNRIGLKADAKQIQEHEYYLDQPVDHQYHHESRSNSRRTSVTKSPRHRPNNFTRTTIHGRKTKKD